MLDIELLVYLHHDNAITIRNKDKAYQNNEQ